MKADEREELIQKEEVRDTTGTCVHCKQIRVVEVPESWTQEDIDEYVAEICDCTTAKMYANRKRRNEKIDQTVESVFREGRGTPLPDEARELLKKAARLITAHELEACALKLNGVTGTVNEGKDGVIKVTGSKKLENGMEV